MESSFKPMMTHLEPIKVLLGSKILRDHPNLIFQYSIYVNGTPGDGVTKFRAIKEIKNMANSPSIFSTIIQHLNFDEEVAIHSLVAEKKDFFQIPLIDFANPSEEELVSSISELQKTYNFDVYIFKSGRSFHAYMDTLLTIDEWKKFLGKMIHLNRKAQIVDVMWVGHSLIQGYSALRLSRNTSVYLSEPIFYKKIQKNNNLSLPNLNNDSEHLVKNHRSHR